MYDHKFFFEAYCIHLILVCNIKNIQCVSTGSCFLHIMIRQKRDPHHASNNFSFELYSIADDENGILISYCKYYKTK